MTVDQLLAGSGLPQSEARTLAAHALSVSTTWLLAHGSEPVDVTTTQELFHRRHAGEPIAYITGSCQFYGRQFACNPSTLIPRPRTELLVEDVIASAYTCFASKDKPCPVRILELGTGTGCIAVTLALELARKGVPTDITASDISPDALTLAQQNWHAHKPVSPYQRVTYLQSDLLSQVPGTPYDILVANLPYVEDSWATSPEAPREVTAFEPASALYAGPGGLDCYRRLHNQLKDRLPVGGLFFECADSQKSALSALFLAELAEYGVRKT